MKIRSFFVIAFLVMTFSVVTAEVVFGQEAITDRIRAEDRCMEVQFLQGKMTTVVNQTCLTALYSAQIAQVEARGFTKEKPKTKLCRVVEYHRYGVASMALGIEIGGWVTKPAECLDEGEEEASGEAFDVFDPNRVKALELKDRVDVPQTTFYPGSSAVSPCLLRRDEIGLCADKLCQPIETHLRKYRTCGE